MKKYFVQFMTVVAALVLVACSTSDDDDDNSGNYDIKAMIDGNLIEVNQSGDVVTHIIYPDNTVNITAYNSNGQGFTLWLDEVVTLGVYDLSDMDVTIAYIKNAAINDHYYFEEGTMTITEFDYQNGLQFNATFSGVAGFGDDPYTITGGVADIDL